MIKVMKTAATILEGAQASETKMLAERLVAQLLEVMPELEGVSAWPAVGQRRSLDEVGRDVCSCSLCGGITSVGRDPCRLCTDPKRDGHVLCVVEDPADIALIQKSGGFFGRYHALMGKISPMKGDGPGNLRIQALLSRVEREGFEEVILALSTDVEGDATACLIGDLLKDRKVKVTRLVLLRDSLSLQDFLGQFLRGINLPWSGTDTYQLALAMVRGKLSFG